MGDVIQQDLVSEDVAFQAAMLIREGFTQESVAKRVGVGEITLNRALRRRGWKDANGDIVIPYDIFVRFGGYENALKRQQWRGA